MRHRWKLVVLLVTTAVVWSATGASAVGISGRFVDDDYNTHEQSIEAIASHGITHGCNPPTNDRFCPDDDLSRGEMAALLHRAFNDLLTPVGSATFSDDNSSIFEADIEWLARTGVTIGCNPPSNTRFCPTAPVTRGQMAAFITRALDLPTPPGNRFSDDNGSPFENEIEALAGAGITYGCNPPANTHFCPGDVVSRGQMAAFIARSLDLEPIVPQFLLRKGWKCSKDGETCAGSATSPGGRTVQIIEGWDQALPASPQELSTLNSSQTRFQLRVNGSVVPLTTSTKVTSSADSRYWSTYLTMPSSGTVVVEGRWYWGNELIRRTTVTVTIDA